MAIYLISEGEDGQPPTQESLNGYAMKHSIGYPLLADINGQAQSRFSNDGYIPSYSLFSPGPTVEIVDGEVTATEIEALLGI